ncbi:MAG TPA: MFS transporter, partial [Chloroflexota bacterium]|nr:MFS transporter [Chloroflexota bacterium]
MSATALVREYVDHIRAFSPSARLFLVAAMLGGLSSGVSGVLLNLYILALGYDREFLGRLLSFGPVGAVVGAVLAVPLVYFLNTKRAMLAGITFAGTGAVLLLISSAPDALRAGIALTSMGSILFYTAVPPFLTKHSTQRERAHLFGITVAAYVVSAAAGGLLAGYLYRAFALAMPEGTPADAYRMALFAGALLTATGIPLIALVREDASSAPTAVSPALSAPRAQGILPAVRERVASLRTDVLESRTLWLLTQFILADVLIRFGGNLVLPFMNVHFIRELGTSEEMFGTLRFLERALVVGATLAAAPLALRFGPVTTIVLTQILS